MTSLFSKFPLALQRHPGRLLHLSFFLLLGHLSKETGRDTVAVIILYSLFGQRINETGLGSSQENQLADTPKIKDNNQKNDL